MLQIVTVPQDSYSNHFSGGGYFSEVLSMNSTNDAAKGRDWTISELWGLKQQVFRNVSLEVDSFPFIRDQTGIANGVLDQHSEPRCN